MNHVRKRARMPLLAGSLLLVVAGWSGCGGHGGNPDRSYDEHCTLPPGALPDLAPEPGGDFFHGLWLGRGLYTNTELDRAFCVAANLGVRVMLVEVKWDYVEPENDVWQWNNEETLDIDHVVELATRYDIEIVPYFNMMMPWGDVTQPPPAGCLGQANRWQHHPPEPEEYAEYVLAVVDRLVRGGVAVPRVELDNEVSNNSNGKDTFNCFIRITAAQLKTAHNTAYRALKQAHPEILVPSTSFSFPGMPPEFENAEEDKIQRNEFVQAYFTEEPPPEFDFLALHGLLSGTGNPWTRQSKDPDASYEYNFGSYHDGYDMWRDILDSHGFAGVPIVDLEVGALNRNGMQDAQLLQRAIFARMEAAENNIRGIAVSYLTTPRESPMDAQASGITDLVSDYGLRDGYFAFHNMMATLAVYPVFDAKISGEVNKPHDPWVVRFTNASGGLLYAAWLPYDTVSDPPPTAVDITVGPHRSVRVLDSLGNATDAAADSGGNVTIQVDAHPTFVEIQAP